ncbi:helix-turn-helix domain-containing protein [Hyphomicrobium sp. CS1GBMeth3]|uniref:helix-turn-helix domain-containing protein n=1 Tax=Hyphomicrobium sp. CS1GBMeth3 TaxID=1892845 RepID=UPI0009320286|nr:helix-turn-helix domain-containing protein [Hyphomicrobium sp. CS1GBMeth3]
MGMLTDHNGLHAGPPCGEARPICAASTHDIDEQAALLRGWNQTYDQISAGPFEGALLETQLASVHLFREVTSNALHQTGALPTGTIAVGVPLALRGNATFCGRACNGAQLHVFSGNDAFEFLSPCGLDIAGFVLAESDLCSALTADEVETLIPTLASPHLRAADHGAAFRLRRIFTDVCEVLMQSPDVMHDPARFSSMSRDVIAALATALDHAQDPGSDGMSPARRASIVRQARDLVTQSPDAYTRVEELCRTLGVSRRALQYSFQETLGLKPSTYLRAVRMNGARRAMKEASSVAEAATLWGFWHFGRFARDYKAMFGELPSEAFRRVHGISTAQ